MRWIDVVFLSLFVVCIAADKHLNAIGPFGKHHTMNSELSHTHPCHRGSGLSSFSSMSHVSETISSLNISATFYSNNELINVSWTSISSPCKDDFVGIYFIEISLSSGKYFDPFLTIYLLDIMNEFLFL